jgi:hypothetical protein
MYICSARGVYCFVHMLADLNVRSVLLPRFTLNPEKKIYNKQGIRRQYNIALRVSQQVKSVTPTNSHIHTLMAINFPLDPDSAT